ncbi:MAG: phosphodiester glycosidase family protein [Candidatus Woesebacteria bacterium]
MKKIDFRVSPIAWDGIRAIFVVLIAIGAFVLVVGVRSYQNLSGQAKDANDTLFTTQQKRTQLEADLASASARIQDLESQDQRLRNDTLQKEIAEIKKVFAQALASYEDITDLKEGKGKGLPMDKTFAAILSDLSKENYASASTKLTQLAKDIKTEQDKFAAAANVPANVPVNNSAPGSGYSRQTVQTDIGPYVVDIVAADLNSTRVIVDTASDTDCGNNCPVLPLATYVSRSGAFAGINGTYFCPESYPACAGKTNSYDLLVMNKKKTYFNSANNVYSQNPAAIFSGNSARFVAHAQDAGRDTGVDAVISNFPLLIINGQIQFGGNSDPKMGSKGNRSFIGSKGSTAYIGILRNVTVAEGAHVLKALGLEHAMNLDSGGSTALWFGGYKAGPGRNLPNAVLFVRK